MIRVAALLSIGRHPASGRARRAGLDARGLELALRMPNAEVRAFHAGDPHAASLRDYLGMGLETLNVLNVAPGCDPVPALVEALRGVGPDLIICGMRAEAGEGSGMVPYLIAEALGHAVVCDAAAIECASGTARVVQGLPRGRRREVVVTLPAVVLVNSAAPAARAPAFARARRGRIVPHPVEAREDAFLAACEMRPWRARPKRMAVPSGGSAQERMKALTEAKAGEGRLLVNPVPEEAARAVRDYLVEKRFLRGAGDGDGRG
ncbi:electron transfer flavoprotein beta subunit [Breoghania corrubedonensis]|uniref:Electron transfer flavoprotein beta subunit n=1 Tax=Breoghania corrubedonensis TaxID=665038 RepID=A0A2T5V7V2_9HYPH|nr:electron transfer flavoprotein subunit beta [Breoghania corrubedonensis]PTW59837.1 electron transfer flavoprotein beta subunit [Breoghania corrubedonensis]